jgi:arginine/lysine/ornithine decarboxylase
MAAGNYCLAMFTLADDEEAYDRMEQALWEIDRMLWNQETDTGIRGAQPPETKEDFRKEHIFIPDSAYPLTVAWDMPRKMTKLSDAVGCPVGDFVNLYPPGIPLLVPGEILNRELYEQILLDRARGLRVQGIEEQDGEVSIHTIQPGNYEIMRTNPECLQK